MPKNKIPLVLKIALSDRESFKILPTKKQQKKLYNKCRNRLIKQGLNVKSELFKNKMVSEIRSELFKLQKPYVPKSEQPKPEDNPVQDNFRMHGVDIWGEAEPQSDPIDQLERNYNETVAEGFRDVFCPICRSNPCVCRYEGDE